MIEIAYQLKKTYKPIDAKHILFLNVLLVCSNIHPAMQRSNSLFLPVRSLVYSAVVVGSSDIPACAVFPRELRSRPNYCLPIERLPTNELSRQTAKKKNHKTQITVNYCINPLRCLFAVV